MDDTADEDGASEAVPNGVEAGAVEQEMNFWLQRSPDLPVVDEKGYEVGMIDFWRTMSDCSLCRVALPACGLMLSQSATERANKVPKDIWSLERQSVMAEHMVRDVYSFIHNNLEKFPHPKFSWDKDTIIDKK